MYLILFFFLLFPLLHLVSCLLWDPTASWGLWWEPIINCYPVSGLTKGESLQDSLCCIFYSILLLLSPHPSLKDKQVPQWQRWIILLVWWQHDSDIFTALDHDLWAMNLNLSHTPIKNQIVWVLRIFYPHALGVKAIVCMVDLNGFKQWLWNILIFYFLKTTTLLYNPHSHPPSAQLLRTAVASSWWNRALWVACPPSVQAASSSPKPPLRLARLQTTANRQFPKQPEPDQTQVRSGIPLRSRAPIKASWSPFWRHLQIPPLHWWKLAHHINVSSRVDVQ